MQVEVLKRVGGGRGRAIRGLICAARAGCGDALGQLFVACTPYLVSIAREELPAVLRAKTDAEDAVQQTFLDAQVAFGGFQGCSRARLVGWLRSILLHNLQDVKRRYGFMDPRGGTREVSLDGILAIERWEPSDAWPGPCESALLGEQECSLADALATLPQHYRTVIQHHHIERLTYVEIGRRTERSADSVRKLDQRALRMLCRRMQGAAL